MSETVVLKFSKKLETIPLEIADADGTVKKYTLRELNDGLRDDMLEDFKAAKILDSSGKVTVGSGIQRIMVSRVLFDEKGENVTLEVIKEEFPAKVVTALFLKAAEMNGMGADAEEDAGND